MLMVENEKGNPSMTTTISLEGRTARCAYCRAEVPSTEHERLAFFEYRGPGSRDAERQCKHCRYFDTAHDPEHMQRLARSGGERRPTIVEQGRCPGFETDPNGNPYDSYFCGCRGWN